MRLVIEVQAAYPDLVAEEQQVESQAGSTGEVVLGEVLRRERPGLVLPPHFSTVADRDFVIAALEQIEHLTGEPKAGMLICR